jgi:aromatic-L-amino-acid/L-tryptophan decarboxylase
MTTTTFDLDHSTRRRLSYMLMDKIDEYYSSLSARAVQPPKEQRRFTYTAEPIPEQGEDPEAVFERLLNDLIERGFHISSANYLGLMNPTPTFVSVLAEALVAAINPQLASVERSATASMIEKQTVDWVGRRVGWTQPFGGVFATGGSEANFTALQLALVKLQPAIIDQGLQSLKSPAVFYASSESHHSLDKAAGMLGLGRQSLRRIGVNDRLQMDLEQLERRILSDLRNNYLPFCVVGTAGTTNAGAIDDLRRMAEISNKYGLWFHVDGAYGAAVIFSDKYKNLVSGIELADSVTIDPHKWLAMPFAAGIFLTTHPKLLSQAYGTAAPYLQTSEDCRLEDNFQISSQWSRRMNSLKLWATLKVHGRLGYELLIENQMKLASGLARWVNDSELFTLAAPQVLPSIIFRVNLRGVDEAEIAAANRAVVEEVNRSGQRWISLTTVAGRSAIRTMVISYLTTEAHLLELEGALRVAAERVINKRP